MERQPANEQVLDEDIVPLYGLLTRPGTEGHKRPPVGTGITSPGGMASM
jgi:hypothetical protein